ncbi:MAG: SpvB/TcaC N-terminal domain-containing protein, partial [bacterium]
MSYKYKIIYRLICVFLVFFHLCVFTLRDAAIVFAQDQEAVENNIVQSEGAIAEIDSSESGEGESQLAPPSEEGAVAALASAGEESQSQSNPTGFNSNAFQNLQPSLFTGALTYSVPISVPSGRKGIQPNIALNYSSQSGNGILGVGWLLDLGSIERSTKNGVPKYNSQDTFIFKSGGSTVELVSIGGNEYRAKIEEAFMRFTFDGYFWTVKDKSGITYYFGQTVASQQDSGSNVFKWCLDKVQDTLGNYMTLTYIKDGGQIYPDTINYTGFDGAPSLDPAFQVDFDYIDSRDDFFFSYRSNFIIKTNKLLSTITVKQNGSRIRKYMLSYQQSPSTKRLLLVSVVQHGLDDTSFDSTSLPPITFQYQETQPGWQQDPGWVIPDLAKFVTSYRNDQGIRFYDMNLDGLTDITRGYEYHNSGPVHKYIFFNNFPNKTWTQVDTSSKLLNIFNRGGIVCDSGMRIVDINADGWLDLIRAHDTMSIDNTYYSYLSDKQVNSWIRDDSWLMPSLMRISYTYDDDGQWPDPVHYTGVVFCDVNSDGHLDILKAEGDSPSAKDAYIHNGYQAVGWSHDISWNMPDGNFNNASTQLADVNGDGLPDFVIGYGTNKKTYINNGSNWIYDYSWQIPDGDLRDGGTQLVDINADGLV